MRTKKKLPLMLLFSMLFGIILTVSIGLSIWLITESVEIKPGMEAENLIKEYFDVNYATYNGNILLPSGENFEIIDVLNEDLVYYYKLIKKTDSDPVDGEKYYQVTDKKGPIKAGIYSVMVIYVLDSEIELPEQFESDAELPENPENSLYVKSEIEFTINKATITLAENIFIGMTKIYDGNIYKPEIDVNNLPKEIKGVTYTYESGDLIGTFNGASNAGNYKIYATFDYDKENYNYVEPLTADLIIEKKSLSNATIYFEGYELNGQYIFYYNDGKEIEDIVKKLRVSIALTEETTAILTIGNGFSAEFDSLVGTASTTDYTVKIKGDGNYKDEITATYTIKEASKELVILPAIGDTATHEIVTYNGQIQRPTFTVEDKDGHDFTNDENLSLEYNIDTKTPGIYTVIVNASLDGYTSASKSIGLIINKAKINIKWGNKTCIYNGEFQNPTVDIVDGKMADDDVTVGIGDSFNTMKNANAYGVTAKLSGEDSGCYELVPSQVNETFTINKKKAKIIGTYEYAFDNDFRTWDAIKLKITEKLQFQNVLGNDNIGVTVTGMNNGVYAYGSDEGSNYITTSNVVGSTYLVTVTNSNLNYELERYSFIFKYKTALVNGIPYTVEDAIVNASSGGVITFYGNSTGTETYVKTCFTLINKSQGYQDFSAIHEINNKQLLIPFNDSTEENNTDKNNTEVTGNVYSTLVIPEGITVNVKNNGSIVAASKIGYKQSIVATGSSTRGVLVNDGDINCGSGLSSDISKIKAYGYIKGKGTIVINKYSQGTENMSIYDFAGGSIASNVKDRVVPMNAWSMHNNSCDTKIMSGAEYYGFAHFVLTAPIIGPMSLDSPVLFIGDNESDKCIFLPLKINDKTYVMKKADLAELWKENPEKYQTELNSLSSITGSNQTRGQKDIFELFGDYSDAEFEIELSGVKMKTKKNQSTPCPLSFQHVIIQNGASFNVSNSDYLFLPGSSCVVEKGGTLTVASDVHTTFSRWEELNALSGGFKDKCIDKTDAKLEVNGTLNVYGHISGKIDSASEKAVFTIGDNAEFSTSARTYNPVTKDGDFLTPSVTIDLKPLEGENQQLNKGTSYLSEIKDGNVYWWTKATSVKYITIILYDPIYNQNNEVEYKEIEKIKIQLVERNEYNVKESMFDAHKDHYTLTGWNILGGGNFIESTLTGVDQVDFDNPSLELVANWELVKYEFDYYTSYGYDENGKINYLIDDAGVTFTDNLSDGFTIKIFESGPITIDTKAYYNNKNMDGWYLGMDKSTGIRINSITKEEFEKILSDLNGSTSIPLYCEFTDEQHYNVIITNKGNEEINDMEFEIGYSIKSGGVISSIPLDTENYDGREEYRYFFNGFIDENGKEYSLEGLLTETIESDMIFRLKWSEKFALNYDDGVTHYYKPGTIAILRKDTESTKYQMSETGDYIVKCDFAYWEINGAEVYEYIIPNEIGGEETLIAKFTPNYSIKYYKISVTMNESTVTISTENKNKSILENVNSKLTNEITATTLYVKEGEKIKISIKCKSSNYITNVQIGTENKPFSDKHSSHDDSTIVDSTIDIVVTTKSSGGGGSCLAAGTLITMADGTKVKVEDIKSGDKLLVFNHETGKYDIAEVLFNDSEDISTYTVINLEFSNNSSVKVISEHGFFDLDLMKYVYIDEYNYKDYIGHRFVSAVMVNGEMIQSIVTLDKAYLTEEYIRVYSPVTKYHMNYLTEDILSMPGGINGLFNIFEYDDNLQYNQELMEKDIEEYGLFTYEDFKDLVSYEVYSSFATQYFKVAIAKGYLTWEQLYYYIERYGPLV